MNKLLLIWSLTAALFVHYSCKDKQESKQQKSPAVIIYQEEAKALFLPKEKPEVIASGFTWTEGPLFLPNEEALLFSEIPSNKVYKWQSGKDTSLYLFPSGFTGKKYVGREPGANGLLLNNAGELILMQHGDRRVAKMASPISQAKSEFITLVDNYKGKKLNSPNDATFAKDGSLYFTDPPYGLNDLLTDSSKELDFQGVYILRKNGQLELFTDEIKFPNGICLANDGKTLFVANSDTQHKTWYAFDLDENGHKKSGRVFYEATKDNGLDNGSPDGMKMHKNGYLFASGPDGIWVFNSAGVVVARIMTYTHTSNCAFDANFGQLFMTCGPQVMRLKLAQ